MILQILAIISPIISIIGLGLYFRKTISELIQNVLDDTAEQLNEIFANPTIKKAYSILGNKSGEVRHDEAVREKVADKIVQEIPSIQMFLDKFGIEPVDGLKLMNDPLLQPLIQGFMQKLRNQQLESAPNINNHQLPNRRVM